MSIRIKFGDCETFPSRPGMWIRLVTTDSEQKENAIVITQGHVMLFEGDEVILMSDGQKTTPEVIQEGDRRNVESGMLVTYTPITGIGVTRKTDPKKNGQHITPRVEMPPKQGGG